MRESTRFVFRRGGALAALALLLGGLFPAAAQQRERPRSGTSYMPHMKNSPSVQAAFREVIDKASRSTVLVRCAGEDAALGIVVGADGRVLTKASALRGTTSCRLKDGREFPARLTGLYRPWDLALLEIDAKGLPVVEWGPGKGVDEGSWVAVPGLGDRPVSVGVVSLAARPVREWPPHAAWPGGHLGITLSDQSKSILVRRVLPHSPAARAGFRDGDVITAVEGQQVEGRDRLYHALAGLKPGAVISVEIRRGTESLELLPALVQRPGLWGEPGTRVMGGKDGAPPDLLQHDTWVKPNEVGGPLVGLDGRAVGINLLCAGRTDNYALVSESLRPVLRDLLAGKYPPSRADADFLRGR